MRRTWGLVCAILTVLGACGCGDDGGVPCPTGERLCAGTCVDTSSDHDNCGGCGNNCGDGTCSGGRCSCSGGLTLCGTDCVSTQSDPANCGGCGSGCAADEYCEAGDCTSDCFPDPETCNDQDDDCDTTIDEGLSQSCGNTWCPGTESCETGRWIDCTARTSTDEICDGIDNNCNGSTDEGLSRPCDNACGPGAESCSAGAWGGCSAPPPETEVCDGVDNDCDGGTDDLDTSGCSCVCYPGESEECYTGAPSTEGVGECRSGFRSCAGPATCPAWGPCVTEVTPQTEGCDSRDNNCDGVTDNVTGSLTLASIAGPYYRMSGCPGPNACCVVSATPVFDASVAIPRGMCGNLEVRFRYAYYASASGSDAQVCTTFVGTGTTASCFSFTSPLVRACGDPATGNHVETFTVSAGSRPTGVTVRVAEEGDYGVRVQDFSVILTSLFCC